MQGDEIGHAGDLEVGVIGTAPARGAGVAPQPPTGLRRLIHIVASPMVRAGTTSWKMLCAVWRMSDFRVPKVRSRSASANSKLRRLGL